jgi:hypothetical protein
MGGAMFRPLFAALAAAALFYLVLPIAGAFFVRSSWRRFRSSILDAARLPALGYAALVSAEEGTRFRFSGGVEAMEGRDRIWVRSEDPGLSVAVDMSHARLFSVPAEKEDPDAAGTGKDSEYETSGYDESSETPELLSWRSLPALAEGSSVFIRGILKREGGKAFLGGAPKDPAVVVLYGCPERELLSRCVRQGRQANEYWNRLTPISFALGIACMIGVLLSFARGVFVEDIFLMSAIIALSPLGALLPPGIALYFLYRSAWKRARSLRATRDSVTIPCAAFAHGAADSTLPGGEAYARRFYDRLDPLLSPGGPKVRGMDELLGLQAAARGFTCFGRPGSSPGEPLSRPEDPMAEFIAIPGVPEELARRCSNLARVYTLLSGLALLGAVFVNAIIAFIVFKALL